MHTVYLCNFNLKNAEKTGGKDRATKQKIEALERQSSKFRAFYLTKGGDAYNILMSFWLDINCAVYIALNRPDFFISRGAVGYFSLVAAKIFGTISVREIHAVASSEIALLPFGRIKKLLLAFYFKIFNQIDMLADVRIFNHPFLLEHYQKLNKVKKGDFYCYNGYSPAGIYQHSSDDVYKKYNLSHGTSYLAFTGAASQWHGIDYLIDLQKEFNKQGDNIRIIIAGGNAAPYDPDGVCLNITPLGEYGCSEIISIATLCLLPVKNNRTSPGSPLKLYDYIGHKKYIVAEDIDGYADEVLRYGVGIAINYENAPQARRKIIDFLHVSERGTDSYPAAPVSWDSRIEYWLQRIAPLKNINQSL